MQTIFVAVPSYKDPMLVQTILWATQHATHPDRVRFGIVDQCNAGEAWPVDTILKRRQLRYFSIPAELARGVGWARAMAMSMYEGEDIYLQVDSHTYFREGWDVWLEEALADRMALNPKTALTAYLPAFTIDDGTLSVTWTEPSVIRTRITPDYDFNKAEILEQNGVMENIKTPLPAFCVAAGFIAAPGRYVEEIPADPWIYFYGEEPTTAIRLYTNGWDMWHPVNLPFAHLYNDSKDRKREVHWDAEQDTERLVRWWERDKVSKERFRQIFTVGQLGVYGLGTARSLADFAEFCGVDYANKTVDAKAWR